MPLKQLLAAASVILAACAAASAQTARVYRSPDRRLVARVIRTRPRGYGRGECIVEVRAAGGALVARKDLTSRDGQQGLLADRAAWSPDGQFFVFSTGSTGGHQPWHAPTYIFSRRRRRIYELDDYVGPVSSPSFTLKAPATLETEVWTFADPEVEPLTVDLRTLKTAKKYRLRMR